MRFERKLFPFKGKTVYNSYAKKKKPPIYFRTTEVQQICKFFNFYANISVFSVISTQNITDLPEYQQIKHTH